MKDNEIKITNRGAWLFVMLFVLLMGFVGYIETMPPAKSVTHEQCEEMSQVLSMMTASDAHDTLINKVREIGCDKNNYPIGVLVK